jgi:hypothetical protein
VGSSDVELVRLGRTGRQARLGIAIVALLLLVAVAKPWPGPGPAPAGSATPREQVAAATAPARSSSTPRAAAAGALCVSPDGWRIVADDVELGRAVRTWLVADVARSIVPPLRSTIPVTTLVSSEVERLGFCRPAVAGEAGGPAWSGSLWRQGVGVSASPQLQLAARLDPAPGSIGAFVFPLGNPAVAWPPGLYFLQADLAGSDKEVWLGLLIQGRPS